MKNILEKKVTSHSVEHPDEASDASEDLENAEQSESGEETELSEGGADNDFLYDLIAHAVEHSATDIHVDLMPEDYLVRYRIDGMIHEIQRLSPDHAQKILIQTRVIGRLSFGRTFTALEGQFTWKGVSDEKDVRVTIVPVGASEAAHFRILTPPEEMRDINKLGLSQEDLNIVKRNLSRPQGLVIVGGPTGAGKTTTIYSLASAFDLASIIAVSIENPVEFDMPHIRQVEVDEKRGMTMYEGLKALLRMDPDLLIVPEIRDPHSAVTSARAGAAARFVLTTLHSRDAAAAVEAFHYLSVPYSVLGGALRVIISQELIRKLCADCMEGRELTDEERMLFEESGLAVPEEVFEAKGCEACDNYGYRGRTGIFEVVEIDEDIGKKITQGLSQIELRKLFREKGYKTMIQDGLEKVSRRQTSLDELYHLYWPGAQDGEQFDFNEWKRFYSGE